MTDETTTPAEEATGQPEPSTQPDSAEGQPATSMTFQDALERLEVLRTANRGLREELMTSRIAFEEQRSHLVGLQARFDEATGVHKPVPFPCTVYRGTAETTANGDVELKTLLSQGWSESK